MNHEIGQGVLAWPAVERQTDRYGAVLLSIGPDHCQVVVLDTLAAAGQCGRLVTVVLDPASPRTWRHRGQAPREVTTR